MENNSLINKTFYLFAKPSFFEGFARLIDVGNALSIYRYSKTAEQSDFLAVKNDWIVVGENIKKATEVYVSTTKSGISK